MADVMIGQRTTRKDYSCEERKAALEKLIADSGREGYIEKTGKRKGRLEESERTKDDIMEELESLKSVSDDTVTCLVYKYSRMEGYYVKDCSL